MLECTASVLCCAVGLVAVLWFRCSSSRRPSLETLKQRKQEAEDYENGTWGEGTMSRKQLEMATI